MHGSNAPAKALDTRVDGNPELCRLFLSADKRYAAIGVRVSEADGDALHIAVFDRSTGKWASSFAVKQREDLWSKLRFEGFLGDDSRQPSGFSTERCLGATEAGMPTPLTRGTTASGLLAVLSSALSNR